jgi:hypothetical protein
MPQGGLDLNLDPIVVLLTSQDTRRELDGDVRKLPQSPHCNMGQFMLFALNDMRISRVVLQESEIELGDYFTADAIPNSKLRFNQAPPSRLQRATARYNDGVL